MTKINRLTQEQAAAKLGTTADEVRQNAHITTMPDDNQMAKLEEMRELARHHRVDEAERASIPVGDIGFAGAPALMVTGNKKFQLQDGRILVLGPPKTLPSLALPGIFKSRTERDMKFAYDMASAETAMYIRAIDNRILPDPITSWEDCARLMHELGTLGWEYASRKIQKLWLADPEAYGTEILD